MFIYMISMHVYVYIIQEDLDCPMSSSLKLATMTDDKVFTRCLMADVRMAFPETLAFMYKSDRLLQSNSEKINIVHLDKNEGFGNLIKDEVEKFSKKLSDDDVTKVTYSFRYIYLSKVLRYKRLRYK